MKRRHVRFTETARAQVRAVQRWWSENTGRPEIVAEEIDEAIALLSVLAGVGAPYPRPRLPELRRLYLRSLTSHLYYTVREDEVIVRAGWHAKRKGAPPIKP